MNAPERPEAQLDRTTQDVGNIVLLEHFNVTIPDQRLATLFYVVGLGGTRDPYIFSGFTNMWVNFGRTQVHLPSRGTQPRAQVLRGTAGFVVPDLEALKKRLDFAGAEMKRVVPEAATRFSWREQGGCVEATCPWGNRIRCHAPGAEFGRTELGLVYVDFDVPPGTAGGIARFYAEVMKAPASAAGGRATVRMGASSACCTRRRRSRSRHTTGTTCRSTLPTSRAPMRGCRRAASSRWRPMRTSGASRESSIRSRSSRCSRSSTRCAA